MKHFPDHSFGALLQHASSQIDHSEARLLLSHISGRSSAWLIAHSDALASHDCSATYLKAVIRRTQGEPIAYITGKRGFWTFELAVSPATLIPRTETETLVEVALQIAKHTSQLHTIADLGTGSGAIALALAQAFPATDVHAIDLSEQALDVARANAEKYDIANITFLQGNWYSALLAQQLDMIVSNPPYIAQDDPHLLANDLPYEPLAALESGHDGLRDLQHIITNAYRFLRPDGWIILEHGCTQGAAVRHLLQNNGFYSIRTHNDLESRERVTVGKNAYRSPNTQGDLVT